MAELTRRSSDWRRRGLRLVLTNGVFDLLHVGHVRYLETARSLGDLLIVGVNDDESVQRLKGPSRPLNPASDRAEVVAALAAVDHVTIFGADTADELIARVRPGIYVKGGDYSADPADPSHPPEGAIVRRLGGIVRIIDLVPDRSTSALVTKVQATIS